MKQYLAYNSALPYFDAWTGNEASISGQNVTCGCFHCIDTFHSSTVENWVVEADGSKTAICPRCGVDSVISAVDVAHIDMTNVTIPLLAALHRVWFE